MKDAPEKENARRDLEKTLVVTHGSTVARYAIACLSGLIWSEGETNHFKKVLAAGLKLQEEELQEIAKTLAKVMARLDLNDATIRERIESPAYLSLIRKAFREWSGAEMS